MSGFATDNEIISETQRGEVTEYVVALTPVDPNAEPVAANKTDVRDLPSAAMPTITCPTCGEQATLAVLDSDPLVVTMRRHDGGFAITADNGEIELPIHDCGGHR